VNNEIKAVGNFTFPKDDFSHVEMRTHRAVGEQSNMPVTHANKKRVRGHLFFKLLPGSDLVVHPLMRLLRIHGYSAVFNRIFGKIVRQSPTALRRAGKSAMLVEPNEQPIREVSQSAAHIFFDKW
jgi:hypothetical protein